MTGAHLTSGNTTSCGCSRLGNQNGSAQRHGHASHGKLTGEYQSWKSMKQRCNNPHNISYPYYGARGIKVCERWEQSFESFLEDIGPRPSAAHSLDRIDGAKNYQPGNVRWATGKQQMRNVSDNRLVTIENQQMTLAEAIERFCPTTPKGTVTARLSRGWSIEKALFSRRAI